MIKNLVTEVEGFISAAPVTDVTIQPNTDVVNTRSDRHRKNITAMIAATVAVTAALFVVIIHLMT